MINRKLNLKNGEELLIREVEINDAEKIVKYLNIVGGESDNLLFGGNEFDVTVEEEEIYIENIRSYQNSIMLVGIISGEIISLSSLSTINSNRIKHNSELGISVKKKYWNIGIASAMIEELIGFAKKNKDIKNISLGVRENNDTAINLYRKYNFEKVGFHKNYFNINGEYFDEILMDVYI